MEGVKHARRRLRQDGLDPELQGRIDRACVTPHQPRWLRNDTPKAPTTRRRRLQFDVWVTEKI